MTTAITAPSRTVVALDANQIISITPGGTAIGRCGRIGDRPGDGETVASYTNLAAGVSVTVGPFVGPTRFAIECSAGNISFSVTTPNPAFCTLLGKIEPFVGNRTLTADDNGRLFRCDDASNVTITVPNFLPEGYNVAFSEWGAGTVTFSAGSGATNRSSTSAVSAQCKIGALLVMKNSNGAAAEFMLGGDVS
jgi:hypothetical protein